MDEMSSPNPSAASAVVVTRDRADILGECLDALHTTAVFDEIIVVDEASSDSTPELVARFPHSLRYIRNEEAGGPCFARNIGAARCKNEYIFHFDDDAIIPDNSFFEATLRAFSEPQIGVVALPFRNITDSDAVYRMAPGNEETWVGESFTACSYAVRASLLRRIGGFREYFFYMGEESDLSQRFLDAGFFTAYVQCSPIDHKQPVNRSTRAADFHGRKNDLLLDFLNVPSPHHFYHLARATAHGAVFGLKTKKLGVSISGLAAGYKAMWQLRHERRPISPAAHRTFELLRRTGPLTLRSVSLERSP